MDPLSTAASGIAIVSLALQLIQSVDTISSCIQRVKDASKELKSLAGRLEQLGALLKDIHHLVQQQAALPKHIQAPSATISSCLMSCEESLVPLQAIVDEFTALQARSRSTAARLKSDIKLSIKARDIAGIEKRIQCEVSNLMSAVMVSHATLQVIALPYGRKKSSTVEVLKQQMSIATQGDPADFRSHSPAVRMTRRTVQVPVAYRWLGISKQHSKYILRKDGSNVRETEEQLSEAYEYVWRLPMLRRVFRWRQDGLYGNLMTSLTVYPVVHEFDKSIDDLLSGGSLHDFRHLISSGALHPFTRDRYGFSLLHKAAQYGRLDVCRTLSALGVQPDFAHGSGWSPFLWYLLNIDILTKNVISVDAVRYFLLDLNRIDDFDQEWLTPASTGHTREVREWLWRYSVIELVGAEKLQFQKSLLFDLSFMISSETLREDALLVLELVAGLLDPHLLDHIAEGQLGLLEETIGGSDKIEDSASMGDAFMTFLQRLGVDDVEAVRKEMSTIGKSIVEGYPPYTANKRTLFHHQDGQRWVLEWEYAFDEMSSSELMSEFTAMTADTDWGDYRQWPFFHIYWNLPAEDRFKEGSKWEARRDRRMIKKTRKELARSGQKRTRSRMPGSWTS